MLLAKINVETFFTNAKPDKRHDKVVFAGRLTYEFSIYTVYVNLTI